MSVERGPEKVIRSFLILAAAFSFNACKASPKKNSSNGKVAPIPELSPTPFRPENTSTVSPTPTEHVAPPPLETKEKYLTPENIVFPTATITIPPPTPTSTPTPFPTQAPEVVESEIILSLWEEEMYQAIQELRGNLPPLELSSPLIEVARERSLDMATRNYFSHITPEGLMVFDLLDERGPYYPYVGEILFRTIADDSQVEWAIEEAIRQFLDSPNHEKIFLGENYRLIGIGYALSEEDNFRYVTIIFTSP